MKIGTLASMLGIAPSTIRYYEQIGLLKPPTRSANGYRTYSHASVARLRNIQTASRLGFPLDVVGRLFAYEGAELATKAKEQIQLRLAEVRELQASLDRQQRELVQLLGAMDGDACLPEVDGPACVRVSAAPG